MKADRLDRIGHRQRSGQPDHGQVVGRATAAGTERRTKDRAVDADHLDTVDVVTVQTDGTSSYGQTRQADKPRRAEII